MPPKLKNRFQIALKVFSSLKALAGSDKNLDLESKQSHRLLMFWDKVVNQKNGLCSILILTILEQLDLLEKVWRDLDLNPWHLGPELAQLTIT